MELPPVYFFVLTDLPMPYRRVTTPQIKYHVGNEIILYMEWCMGSKCTYWFLTCHLDNLWSHPIRSSFNTVVKLHCTEGGHQILCCLLCSAKVNKFYKSSCGYHHIRSFYISMYHIVCMKVGYSVNKL